MMTVSLGRVQTGEEWRGVQSFHALSLWNQGRIPLLAHPRVHQPGRSVELRWPEFLLGFWYVAVLH